MTTIIYPTEEKIIELNILILNLINVKKADQPKVLSHRKITQSIDDCKRFKGDLYDKAVILMKSIIKNHAFASGNRRTAFITTKYFILENKGKIKIKDDPSYARAMQGIRENYYSHDEIKDWIKNGKIKQFER